MKGVSVIICCYNSESRLHPTLKHLFNQYTKGIQWEIVLVNNASTDKTAELAQREYLEQKKPDLPFRIVHEPKAGLSYAREKGIEEAIYDTLIFCDDDNWLDPYYLRTAFEIMLTDPDIGALGGQGTPSFENGEPPYFWENQYTALAVGPQAEQDGPVSNGRSYVYGAGLVLNKTAYQKIKDVYGFSFILPDRKGNQLLGGGDCELCYALALAGFKIIYSGKLIFTHYIPAARTTVAYYKKLFRGVGFSSYYLLPYKMCLNKQLNRSYHRQVLMSVYLLIRSMPFAFIGCLQKEIFYRYLSAIKGFYKNYGLLQALIVNGLLYKSILKRGFFQFQGLTPCKPRLSL